MQPLSQMLEQKATPEFAGLVGIHLEELIDKLERAEDPDLLRIAIAKMMGDSNAEVAEQLGCVRRTVERKVQLIRNIWEKEIST